ncbi:unnamed protein product [Linum trigynum]|uniref:Uncharacterized protein n=1 Tax=Linum trigynum TaxID=586398 RepID=A0AAV2CT12_9ROSI
MGRGNLAGWRLWRFYSHSSPFPCFSISPLPPLLFLSIAVGNDRSASSLHGRRDPSVAKTDDDIVQLDGGGPSVHKSAGKRSLGFDLNVEYTSNDDDLLKLGQSSYDSDQHPHDLDDPTLVEQAPDIVVANVDPVGVVERDKFKVTYIGYILDYFFITVEWYMYKWSGTPTSGVIDLPVE